MSGSLSSAIWACECIARKVAGVEIAKALDPLDEEDFITISVRLAASLRGAAKGAEADALRAAIQHLDVDWPRLSGAQRDRVIAAAREEVRALRAAEAKIEDVISRVGDSTYTRTRANVIRRDGLDIVKEPTKADKKIAKLLRRSQMVYVKDEFGKRADMFDKQAKTIVASGLERGLGRDDIAEELGTKLKESQVHRAEHYWQIVANDFANKTRTTSQIFAYSDAGIERYQFSAVMDEVTTSVCRMLNGKTFSVGTARSQLQDALSLDDPEDIKDARPWVRRGRGDGGEDILYYKRGGARHVVAEILSSGEGARDVAGTFKQRMSDSQLESDGINTPPLHGRCRSTLIAV